jgi:hypothetical protein
MLGACDMDGLDEEVIEGAIDMLGSADGEVVGLNEGDSVGFFEGWNDGDAVVGESVGISDGVSVGFVVVGYAVGCV